MSIDICRSRGAKEIFSWVSEQNIASYKRYEKLGFIRSHEEEIRNLPLLGGNHKFYKWRYFCR